MIEEPEVRHIPHGRLKDPAVREAFYAKLAELWDHIEDNTFAAVEA